MHEYYYCDFNQNHLLIQPKLLPCGATSCKKCIEKLENKKKRKILCPNCNNEHFTSDLPTNLKIEELIKKNIVKITESIVENFQNLLLNCQDLNKSNSLLTEDYFTKVRTDIKRRVIEIKSHIDELAEHVLKSVDKLQIQTLTNLSCLEQNFNDKLDSFRDSSTMLVRHISIEENAAAVDYDSIWKYFENNFKSRKELVKYEQKFQKVLKQYSFKPNKWEANGYHIIGNLVDNRFKISKNEDEVLDLEIKENMKISSMCTCGDEIITIESKRSRVLKAYDKNLIFLRESKILEDSIYRISPNLTLASDNLDSVYVCDTADSTVYLLNKELTFIVKQIGNMGSVPGYFINPNDIYFYSNSIFVLDSGNSRIQKFHLDGVFIEAMQLFKNEESNELFENSKNLAIGEDIIAVNAPDKGIHIYSMDLNLGLIIQQLDVLTIEFAKSYLFSHTRHGLLFCYQIFPTTSNKFHFQTVFSRKLRRFKENSVAMLWFDNSLCISFLKESKLAIIKSLVKTE